MITNQSPRSKDFYHPRTPTTLVISHPRPPSPLSTLNHRLHTVRPHWTPNTPRSSFSITSFGRNYMYIETLWKEVKWSMKWPYSMQLNQSRNVLLQTHLFYNHIWVYWTLDGSAWHHDYHGYTTPRKASNAPLTPLPPKTTTNLSEFYVYIMVSFSWIWPPIRMEFHSMDRKSKNKHN